jgi:hypothetical protein
MNDAPRKLLATLLVVGAQSVAKAMTTQDLARHFGVETTDIEPDVEALARRGYVISVMRQDTKLFYLSNTGILAASSVYS